MRRGRLEFDPRLLYLIECIYSFWMNPLATLMGVRILTLSICRGNISSRFSSNSEAGASELVENLEEMFHVGFE